jgi:plasmid stabilization system protein ParE
MTRELHPDAERELREAAQWYGEQSLFAADRFITAVTMALDQVSRDPQRYQSVGGGVQVFRLDRFPYKVYYQFDAGRQHVPLCDAQQEAAKLLARSI